MFDVIAWEDVVKGVVKRRCCVGEVAEGGVRVGSHGGYVSRSLKSDVPVRVGGRGGASGGGPMEGKFGVR